MAALGGFLFGYDTAVVSGAIGFLKAFYSLSPFWQGWAASCALVGCIFGAACAGVISDAIGRKKTLVLAGILFLVSAIGTALPRNLTMFIIFRAIGGVGVGVASMTSPMYIAEISPAKIRGRMVTFCQLAIVIGILASFFVNYSIASPHNQEWNIEFGWRWMFGAEALPATLFMILLFFVPESPRWIAKRGGHERAFAILARTGGEEFARAELADIEDTIAHEEGSILQLFRPGFRLALMVGVLLAVFSQCTGINVFMYYGPEIFKKLGTGTNVALLNTVFIGSTNLIFTFVAIKLIDKAGRKILLNVGLIGMAICLFAMSFATMHQKPILMLVFVLGFIASFAGSMGPVSWTMLAEIFPNRIRGRAMSIATFSLWAVNYIVSQTFPMMNENQVLIEKFHNAFPFWVYGSLCILAIVFSFKYIPETKGKTLEDIERFWISSTERKQ